MFGSGTELNIITWNRMVCSVSLAVSCILMLVMGCFRDGSI